MTGKQILDQMEKEFTRIPSTIYFELSDKSQRNNYFHIQFDDSGIRLKELDEVLFLYTVIESPQDHFAAVVITARLIRELFDNEDQVSNPRLV